jgi:hypothetical protein
MLLLQVTNHQANSYRHKDSKHHCLSSDLGFHDILRKLTSPLNKKIVPHDGNSQQSFAVLPLKPNGQIKTWVHTIEFHPIQQSLGMSRIIEFAGGAFRNTTR